ncbi:hypothetical protein, variant [Verruconis gallopava]|uniref:Cysteine protease n=1 Tax=Verruconis gallopava TaxID=253628 RepID=A0A0D2A2G0_9PEZI|nr:uncharacterized protein PV09_07682 [Verruconis gallopava]XP_016210812.1 hypothetical protein, variant [Verruconis gallopava]KIW00942.1 hypothetical protein PV09_07682 [Verruconis gallopava]KIW00943.1 hypothetical protein, variant [Verruconis gallopava]
MNNVEDLARYGKRFVKMFYDPMPRNDDLSGAPIWCLGRKYDSQIPPTISSANSSPSLVASSATHVSEPASSLFEDDNRISEPPVIVDKQAAAEAARGEQQQSDDAGWPSAFLDDFESRIWMTYRSNFQMIPRSQDPKASGALTFAVRLRNQLGQGDGFTSDTGWGCMIRSGQSLLANALLILKLGRDWRLGDKPEEQSKLLSLFADDPHAPFSLHKFVEHGALECGKHPGEWFGPSATARCIQALTNNQKDLNLRVYISGDSPDIYEDVLFRIATSANGTFSPTLVLVGIRLGIDRITPVYWEALKSSLQLPQSVGIAGGRPSASHYFVGNQSNTFFYLDPHITRPALPLQAESSRYSEDVIATCHTRRLRRIDIREMDPSMLIGFLIRDEEDYKAWKKNVTDVPGGKTIVHISEKEPRHFIGRNIERPGAIDEVETFDTEDDIEEL